MSADHKNGDEARTATETAQEPNATGEDPVFGAAFDNWLKNPSAFPPGPKSEFDEARAEWIKTPGVPTENFTADWVRSKRERERVEETRPLHAQATNGKNYEDKQMRKHLNAEMPAQKRAAIEAFRPLHDFVVGYLRQHGPPPDLDKFIKELLAGELSKRLYRGSSKPATRDYRTIQRYLRKEFGLGEMKRKSPISKKV